MRLMNPKKEFSDVKMFKQGERHAFTHEREVGNILDIGMQIIQKVHG